MSSSPLPPYYLCQLRRSTTTLADKQHKPIGRGEGGAGGRRGRGAVEARTVSQAAGGIQHLVEGEGG